MPTLSLRAPAVAGLFYPADSLALTSSIDTMLAGVKPRPLRPKALIVPHAGYIYSGPIAASAYAMLRPLAGDIHRVVIFGPAHRALVAGLAAPASTAFATPLGQVPVDTAAIKMAATLPQVSISDLAHAEEHCLEVQLPFLQSVLDDFAVAPFVVGGATGEQVAEVMELLWGGSETLIVVSSDLSHYLPYAVARQVDEATADNVLNKRPLAHHEQACGAAAINGLIETARRRHLSPELLDLRNSGDTAGDRSRVVGYAAFAFTEAKHE
jgi:AmmeMemoRadiSam system protein B